MEPEEPADCNLTSPSTGVPVQFLGHEDASGIHFQFKLPWKKNCAAPMEEECASAVPDACSLSFSKNALAIGQEFPDVETCRRTLKDIAVALRFDLRIVKSDRSRFIAKCSKEGCLWRIHAAKCHGVPTFSIRTLQGQHTCDGTRSSSLHHQQASVGWVARSVEARVRDNPQCKPKEILQDIRDLHGVAVSYMQAWRGKERSMAALHGTLEEGYRLLPAYCEQIRKTNPGSVASLYITCHENCFHRLFVSYSAAIYGFMNACRPILELDRAHLNGKFLGTLLCAAAIDATNGLFPLAIAVVDAESDDNWMWFVSELHHLISLNSDTMPRLTILSERQVGVVEAVETFFPGSFHGFCLRFVSKNLQETFKNAKLMNIFWNAVHALTSGEFESKISDMIDVSPDVIIWLRSFPPHLWAVAYFDGVRHGHFTLGITESLCNWALDCHDLPIVQTMEHVRLQMASWFDSRREAAVRWNTILVPAAEKHVHDSITDATCYQVVRASEIEFEILSAERTNIVDIRSRTCSCRRWQLDGVPCAHGAAALLSCGHKVHLFADPCFMVSSYRETYSRTINHVPDRSLWKGCVHGVDEVTIQPPKTRRPPGRPRKKIPPVENLKRPKRIVQCGPLLFT